jgi:DTW domain-containing protein YfiP
VSGIAENWKTGRVVRLNTMSEATRKYAEKINVKDTPTFILFDASGKEQRRWSREAPKLAELPQ